MSEFVHIETFVAGNSVRFLRDSRPGPLHYVHASDLRRIADELHEAADEIEARRAGEQ